MHYVDLGESFQTHIYLQNLASIQPRTSLVKFARSPCTNRTGGVHDQLQVQVPDRLLPYDLDTAGRCRRFPCRGSTDRRSLTASCRPKAGVIVLMVIKSRMINFSSASVRESPAYFLFKKKVQRIFNMRLFSIYVVEYKKTRNERKPSSLASEMTAG